MSLIVWSNYPDIPFAKLARFSEGFVERQSVSYGGLRIGEEVRNE